MPLMVVKKSGQRQAFNRNKLVAGILKACEARRRTFLISDVKVWPVVGLTINATAEPSSVGPGESWVVDLRMAKSSFFVARQPGWRFAARRQTEVLSSHAIFNRAPTLFVMFTAS